MQNEASPRLLRRLVFGLGLATALVHGFVGGSYVTRSEHLDSRPTWQSQGLDYLHRFAGWDTESEHDAAAYNRAATEALRTGVPRSRSGAVFWYAPVYAYFLAGCYGLGGVRLLAVVAPQALLSGLTVVLLGLTVYRLAPARPLTALLVTGGLYLINFRLALYVGYVYPTMLLMVWVAAAWFLATGKLTRRASLGLALSLILGVGTQAGFFVLATAGALWLAWQGRRRQQPWALVGAVGVLVCVGIKLALAWCPPAVGPRDSLQADGASVLWEANNPYYETMTFRDRWERRPGNPWTTWHATEQEQQRYETYLARVGRRPGAAARLWIRENPAVYLKLCLIRLRTQVGAYTGQMSPRNRWMATVLWLLVFPAGIWGLWRLRHHPGSGFVLALFAGVLVSGTLIIVEWYLRYRLPLELILTGYAGVGYAWLTARSAATPRPTPTG